MSIVESTAPAQAGVPIQPIDHRSGTIALIGCGALKEVGARAGEIKSMHTRAHLRGRGLGRLMLEHILGVARARGYTDLWLETGSMDAFIPARKLYATYGFR